MKLLEKKELKKNRKKETKKEWKKKQSKYTYITNLGNEENNKN